MKVKTGIAIGMLALGLAGCASGPNPCIGTTADKLPCQCPATTNPGCMPWIHDAKQPDAGTKGTP